MTSYDWLLIFLGIGLLVLFIFDRTIRTLFTLMALWIATLASAAVYRVAAFRLQAVTGPNVELARGVVFDVLLVIFLVVFYILTRVAFPVTKLPKLGLLDNLLGLLVGVVVAVVLVSLLVNSMGVMVMERWVTHEQGWANLRAAFLGSGLRPYTTRVLGAYDWLFVPFFQGLPPVLYPQ